MIWIQKTGRISRSIKADFITSTVAFEGRVFSAQTVSSTLARQNSSLRSGGSVFGPEHHQHRGLRGKGFSAQAVSSTLARQNRSLRSGWSVFGPGHHLQRGLRGQGLSAQTVSSTLTRQNRSLRTDGGCLRPRKFLDTQLGCRTHAWEGTSSDRSGLKR